MTTDTDVPACWEYVLTLLPRWRGTDDLDPVLRWNGEFTAACPCGRTVAWDAYRCTPRCACTDGGPGGTT
jgi:hypothetical protein